MASRGFLPWIVCFLGVLSIASSQNFSVTSTESSVDTSTVGLSSLSTADLTTTISDISSLIASPIPTTSAAVNATSSDELSVEDDSSGHVQGSTIPSDESFNNDDAPPSEDGDPIMPLGLPLSDAEELNAMETTFFTYFVENAPAGGEPPIKLPNVTCPSSLSKRAANNLGCPTFTNLGINIHFHYVRNGTNPAGQKQVAESRVASQVTRLNLVYNRLGINFNYVPTVHRWLHPKFSNHILSFTDPTNVHVKTQTKIGGRTDLNVWIVDRVIDGKKLRAGYSSFPEYNYDKIDGIVIDQEVVGTALRNTLIHEVGHWMGLKHTFGIEGKNCVGDDDLLDTEKTSGLSPGLGQCVQTYCNGTVARVENHMSYSSCRGSKLDASGKNVLNLDAFTTNQKARMYSRFLKLRQGVRSACVPKDPSITTLKRDFIPGPTPSVEIEPRDAGYGIVEYDQLLVKRKLLTTQNLLDGVCPDPSAPDDPDVVANNGGFGTSGVPTASGTQTIVVGSASATFKGTAGTGITGGTSTSSGAAAATSSKSAAGRTPLMEPSGVLMFTIIYLAYAGIGAFIML